MVTRDITHWWIFRRLEKEFTLFFPIFVETERDSSEAYGATVASLEDRIARTGQSEAKAEKAALDIFCELIGHGLETGRLEDFLARTSVL